VDPDEAKRCSEGGEKPLVQLNTAPAHNIDAVHAHALIRVGADDAVAVFGRAKQAASHALRSHLPGGIWGRSSHVVRINSREHGTNAKNYILAHADRGAWIYPTPEDPHPPEPTTRRRS
jgi:hypothetical protein